MKATIESTNVTTRIDGVKVRLWRGVTENGVRCNFFVHRIAVDTNENTAEFDRQLREQLEPAELVIPLADVLSS